MALITEEFVNLYRSVFGAKPHVVKESYTPPAPVNLPVAKGGYTPPPPVDLPEILGVSINNNQDYSVNGTLYKENILGADIWLPTRLVGKDANGNEKIWLLPYCVFNISGSSSWIKTPLAERRGTVKELYSIDDYKINLKGFFIDIEERFFPESDLQTLKLFHELGLPLQIQNAAIDIFLNADDRVVIENFDLMSVTGGKKHNRPFTMNLMSDSVFVLEVE